MEDRLTGLKLPLEGEFPFVPRKGYKPSMPLPRSRDNHGYLDEFKNEWTKGRSVTPGQHSEWDVILSPSGRKKFGHLSRDGKHINVSWDGKITHGEKPGNKQ